VYLSLPLPEMRELASSMEDVPPDEVQDVIVDIAEEHHEQSSNGVIDPYWIHADVQEIYEDVSIGQVAAVLLAWVPQR
jgi:hypothetical protein